jgi:HD-GYP domain-containing protein (c-di-GMP phosphodiesterase class II)
MDAREARVGEVLAALSRALDLVEGQPPGHAVRTSMIAIRLAQELRLPEAAHADLFYASMLKDSGCSNNSARIHKIFGGDELLSKRNVKLVDWASPFHSMLYAMNNIERGGSLAQKLLRAAGSIGPPGRVMDEVTLARCTRGADIARRLGFGEDVAEAVHRLDEHWDGNGSPHKLAGADIPPYARILCLAQTLEIFVSTFGIDAGYDMLRERQGRWFDPELVKAAAGFRDDTFFWMLNLAHANGEEVMLPVHDEILDRPATSLDSVCEAFAEIIDAKSSFTGRHSVRVTEYAMQIARTLHLPEDRLEDLRRAALLHDLGKLGVPNSILDKPGKLTDEEFETVRAHPRHTHEILAPIEGFERVTAIASAHHERLDGRGYWRGLTSEQLDLEMRIVAAADVFDALSAERPYRSAMPADEALRIMRKEAGSALDPGCVEALAELYSSPGLLAA